MAKHIIPKRVTRLIRRNPQVAGVATALLAVGGLVALGSRNPLVRDRARELKNSLMRHLSPMAKPTQEGAALVAAMQPY